MQDQKEVSAGGAQVLIRLYWLFLGNAILAFLLVFIVEKHPKLPSLFDVAYLATLASLILVRYVDIRFLNGQTGEGKPATVAHWRRYAMLVAPVGLAAWLLTRTLVHFQGAV